MSNHTVDLIENWVDAFVRVYWILIIAWIVSGMVRLPYNLWTNRIRTFLDDTVSPFVGLFRRFAPRIGMFDISPMLAIISLYVIQIILHSVFNGLRPGG